MLRPALVLYFSQAMATINEDLRACIEPLAERDWNCWPTARFPLVRRGFHFRNCFDSERLAQSSLTGFDFSSAFELADGHTAPTSMLAADIYRSPASPAPR